MGVGQLLKHLRQVVQRIPLPLCRISSLLLPMAAPDKMAGMNWPLDTHTPLATHCRVMNTTKNNMTEDGRSAPSPKWKRSLIIPSCSLRNKVASCTTGIYRAFVFHDQKREFFSRRPP